MRPAIVAAVMLTLSGCAGHSIVTQPPTTQQSRVAQTFASKPLPIPAYVVTVVPNDAFSHFVFLDSSYRTIGYENSDALGQMQMDPQGDIYAFSPFTVGDIVEKFFPPYGKNSYAYIKGPNRDGDIGLAVDPKTGNFTVSGGTSIRVPPALGFYRDGETSPCKVLSKLSWALGPGAYDGEGVPFMPGYDSAQQWTVLSFAGGCNAKVGDVKMFLPEVSGLIFFNAKDQLVVATNLSNNTPGPIVTYPHPDAKTGRIGKALFKTVLGQIDGNTPYFASFNSDGTQVLAYSGNALGIYAYPSGGKPIKVIHFAADSGVAGAAAYPPLIP